MKSRKLKAVLAAVSALAVLATAMTGFAATVTTTTTYDDTDKVEVTAVVADANGSEITYLVKTEGDGVADGIVYIDQQTAKNGAATFTYKVDKTKIGNYAMNVTMGSNGEDTFSGQAIALTAGATVSGEGYTITYPAYAAGDVSVNAIVEVTDSTKEIASIKVGENDYTATPGAVVVPVENGTLAAVEVTLKDKYVAPGVTQEEVVKSAADADVEKYGEGKKMNTTIIKFVGNPDEVGVEYNGQKYKSEFDTDENDGYAIVQLVADGEIINNITAYAE